MSQSRKAPRTRQQRKAAARAAMRLAKTPEERERAAFRPIINEVHPHGPRSMRQHRSAFSRGVVGDGWRRKKALRGEYYGRKLEAVIRSRAPLSRVRAERTIIRALLAS